MCSDLRLIRLCRKTNGHNVGETVNKQQYLSTDYFDVMYCIKKKFSDDFTEIMGINSDFKQDEDEIAVQTYALFCCNDVIEKYQDRSCYGNPFSDENGNENKSYLSVMQVYVAPEFISRYYGEIAGSAYDLVKKIEEDIHETIDKFISVYKEEKKKICYRIYRLLSTGDFAVVIRSSEPHTSFEASNVLRKRYVLEKSAGNEKKKLVLYKTYTLLTMSKNIVSVEPVAGGILENQFAIRCCYSKKYWSEKSKVEEFLKENNITVERYNLPGRYDFAVYLTEQEFKQIFPYLLKYKNIQAVDDSVLKMEDSTPDYSNSVKYLAYLLQNQYLSYINERYLIRDVFGSLNAANGQPERSNIFQDAVHKEFLEECNKKIFKEVQEECIAFRDELESISVNRRYLIHYMDLLHKLLFQCHAINNLSDTRTYAYVLLKYIRVLLSSLKSYFKYLKSEPQDESDVLDLMEGYLKEAVGALDVYSQYIRNNNLQSLQTPNYNIESNTSMEKLLIAFGEIVYTCINNYSNCDEVQSEKLGLKNKKYHPIIVPDLRSDTIGIEMMFPEWNIYKKDVNAETEKDYLMIISCPTLKELGNVPASIAALYHEAAHHLRYEKRDERNESILKYSLARASEIIAEKIVQNYTYRKGQQDIENRVTLMLRDALFENIRDYLNRNAENRETLKKAPLTYMEEYTKKQIEQLLSHAYYEEDVSQWVSRFVREMVKWAHLNDKDIKELLSIMEEKMSVLVKLGSTAAEDSYIEHDKGSCETWRKTLAEFFMASKKLFVAAGETLVDQDKHSEWKQYWESALSTPGSEPEIPWDMITDKEIAEQFVVSEENRELLKNLFVDFQTFCNKLSYYHEQYQTLIIMHNRSAFLEKLYRTCLEKWQQGIREAGKADKAMEIVQFYNEFGRYQGIDLNMPNNKKIFVSLVNETLTNSCECVLTTIHSDIACYREITADIFMCILMGLEPLGYLRVIVQKMKIEGNVPEEYVRRIIHVVAAVWCDLNGSDYQEFYTSYQEICQQLFEYTVKYIEEMKLKDYCWKEQFFDWSGQTSEEAVEQFCQQIERFGDRLKLSVEQDQKSDLMEVAAMLKIIFYMAVYGSRYLPPLFNADKDNYKGVLKVDYLRGKEFLKRVKAALDSAKKGFSKGEMVSYLNAPWIKYKHQKMEEVNLQTAELLLEMYYENKCHSILEARRDYEREGCIQLR